ncbi:hypothetical protein [Mycobacterium xenopi]|uniref:DUF8021 domain-containing protein n=1 Tax=Mycobacterium xenopi TaxID=1789 RepID=A0AAD1LZD8_MYCXE|nr:hypothetical protein [Mycobacterium xenopi]EID09052.1 hypothetical protein MXEN_20470 [Mycobacterium xenopi RIVM700367]MDA3639159.1 hypothetical protein [Mycobacterium xenopi]MDA3657531.1 hypothetical protein [Mycobacterium xenopi]MDA3661423.1 hypothetical protein [Mycobacterium xenopi]ORX20748.1 hypothetical protein AWC32_04555 [Mycobacterium xenopi]
MVSEADRIAAAQSYIDALVSHDADAVPFAPGCTRIEQGVRTGFSGNHLRRSLNRGLQFRLIAAASQPEYTVVGDEVRAVYDVVTKPRLFGRQVAARIDETFVIPADDGMIHHITAQFRPYIRRT